jgi:hypothetical protein
MKLQTPHYQHKIIFTQIVTNITTRLCRLWPYFIKVTLGMINNFPVHKTYTPGGYASFRFLSHNLVTTYPMISEGKALVPVATENNVAFFDGYATRETLNYEEEPVDNGNGTYYNLTVSGFVPGEAAALIDLMETLAYYRHLVIVKDPLGLQRLVGSPAAPLDFQAKFNSGTARPDSKGFNFKFTGQSLYRSPVYTG